MAEWIGKVEIQKKGGKKLLISDVLHVLEMKCNILILGQLLEKGYSMKMKENDMKAFDEKSNLILKVHLSKNRILMIEINVVENECLATEFDDEKWKWHRKLGHINFKRLSLLKKKKMVWVQTKICVWRMM